MQCLKKYKWVKLPRSSIPVIKGIMGHWMRLSAKAAYGWGKTRVGNRTHNICRGRWVGPISSLQRILGCRNRKKALSVLEELSNLSYLRYEYSPATHIVAYTLINPLPFVDAYSITGNIFAYNDYGFVGVTRTIVNRLKVYGRVFEEADAWLDLWVHTVWKDRQNIFSQYCPVVHYDNPGTILTLESLGERWGWEKTKVWRFFQKYSATYVLHKLPGSYGCLIYNTVYEAEEDPRIVPDMATERDIIARAQAI